MKFDDALLLEYDTSLAVGEASRSLISEEIRVLLEIAAKVYQFDYERGRHDTEPRILVLGRWVHPSTGNRLLAGVNLNYLDEDEADELRGVLGMILKPSRLKNRYWIGRRLLPDIWSKAYRTYDEKYVHSIRATDFAPDLDDYEEPDEIVEPEKEPGLDPNSPAAKAIKRLKDLEDLEDGEAPKDPKVDKVSRLSKDTLQKLAKQVKRKVAQNKLAQQARTSVSDLSDTEREQEAQAARLEKEREKAEREASDKDAKKAKESARLEREIDALDDEIDAIDGGYDESRIRNLDTMIEASIKPKNLKWSSPAQYVNWHAPHKFFEYHKQMKGRVLDYSHGSKLCVLYNIREDVLIMDLVDDLGEMIQKAGWLWDETARIVADDSIDFQCIHPKASQIREDIEENPIWDIIEGSIS